ncbi:LysE family translocator [Dethiosulfatarculus sandiegensis]|uniref:Transporter n=1 Tax=Dethiosulfatarculus sandiegensis TaxID=1429043 RepID=A0A0D2HXU2_9BACT|nr:LysE family transporter [Dethiosulfatarculus sandiegensis]KIX15118.1 transporter [Dethiosulfatarculus sandiegensis]
MLGILLLAIGVMYTPGPVNILSLNCGAQRKVSAHAPFCLGVAVALSFWFILIGYTGSMVINENLLPVISGAGVCFILYLAYKILTSKVQTNGASEPPALLTFKDGFLMQLLNPKAMLVVLPVTTIQFPAAGIQGIWITVWSVGLGALGFGAPMLYAALSSFITRHISGTGYLKYLNIVMGLMLIAVAVDMGYHHVYAAILGR